MCNSNIYNMYLNILIGVIYAFVCVSTYIDIYVCVYIFFSGTFGVMATFENQRPGYFLVTWEDLF